MRLPGLRVFVGTEHVTATAQTDTTAVTTCTCGHHCTNSAHAAWWAHKDHHRSHAGTGRNGSRP